MGSQSSGILKGCAIALAIVVVLAILGVGSCVVLFGTVRQRVAPTVKEVAKKKQSETERIDAAPVTAPKPDSLKLPSSDIIEPERREGGDKATGKNLSEEKRFAIFAELQAQWVVDAKKAGDSVPELDLLDKKSSAAVCVKYGITRDQLTAILIEAATNGWFGRLKQ